MGCGCKKKDALTADSRGVARAFPAPDGDMVALATEPDCTVTYDGPFAHLTVYVVGYGTQDEKLFQFSDRTAAVKHAKANKLTLDPVRAGDLCEAPVLTLLEA